MLAILAIPAYAQNKKSSAGFMLDTNLSYISTNTDAVTTESSATMYGSVFVGAAMDKAWYIGWDTVYTSATPVSSLGTQTLTNLKMGPAFGLFLNDSHSFTISASYYVYSTATYKGLSGSTSSWLGGGYQAQLGYAPVVFESLLMGIRLIYDVSTFRTSTSSSVVTNVSYSKTNIFPAFVLTLRF